MSEADEKAFDQHYDDLSWLEAIHPDGKGRRALTGLRTLRTDGGALPCSPDGKSILVEIQKPPFSESSDIYELRADGRWPITLADARLLTPPGTSEKWPAWQPLCTIYGSDGPDTLTGTSGVDVICGLGGDDTIKAGAGNDIVIQRPPIELRVWPLSMRELVADRRGVVYAWSGRVSRQRSPRRIRRMWRSPTP